MNAVTRNRDPRGSGNADAARITVRTLGQFMLRDARTGEECPFRSRKARALIAYIVLSQEQAISRERAMELLWGSRGEEQARASLRQVLHEIRNSPCAISEAIDIDRQTLRVRPGAIRTDLGEIVQAASRDDLQTLSALMGACADRMIDGLEGIDPAFDDWLRVAREQMLLRLNQVVIAACGSGEPALRRAILSDLQRLNPCDEAIACIVLQLDHELGDLAALHQRYRWLQAAMRRDLDAEPAEATQDLFRRLTRLAPISAPPIPAPPIAAAPPSRPAALATPPVQPPILIVTPIEVADGLHGAQIDAKVLLAELEFALSGIADLRLLSIGGTAPEALAAAGADAIAAYVLRGALHGGDGVFHLAWRLSRLRDGLVLWTDRRTMRDGARAEALEGIAARVAGAVIPTLERDIDWGAHGDGALEGSGYGLYLQGRVRFLSATGLDDMRAAATLFERAVERAPRLVNAYLSLARLYNTDFEQRLTGHDRQALRQRAFDLCSRAVLIDPRSAQAHARLGWCYLRRNDGELARRALRTALELSPYHADCLNEVGAAFCYLGDIDFAMALLTRAFELNPFPRDDYHCDIAIVHMLRRNHARAEENFEIAHNDAIHYAAFRIANLALTREGAVNEAARQRLRARFAETWAGEVAPRDDDILDAALGQIPLQREEDRMLLGTGFRAAGFQCASVATSASSARKNDVCGTA